MVMKAIAEVVEVTVRRRERR
jgi:hypothetical protein